MEVVWWLILTTLVLIVGKDLVALAARRRVERRRGEISEPGSHVRPMR